MGTDKLWTALVNVKAKDGFKFEELIDFEEGQYSTDYIGAWANVMIKAGDFKAAYDLAIIGIAEKNFEVIDFAFLNEYEHYKEAYEITDDYHAAEQVLNTTLFKFCIIGWLFPYKDSKD